MRNKVTSAITHAKRDYFSNITTKHKGQPKKLWKELRKITGNKKNENPVPPILTANKLNHYFANIGTKIKECLPDPGPLNWKNPDCIYSFSFCEIENTCVCNHLKNLAIDSHLDVLDMDSKLLRLGAELLAPSISRLL